MAEKGGTKIVVIITICVVLISVHLAGCIEENREIDSLDIHISNGTNRTYNTTLIIINTKGSEIFNKSFSIDPNEQLKYKDITDKKGSYVLNIKLDDNRFKTYNNLVVDEYTHGLSIHIDYDEIHIAQKVE